MVEVVLRRGKVKKARETFGTILQEHALGEREVSLCLDILHTNTQRDALHDHLGKLIKEARGCGGCIVETV